MRSRGEQFTKVLCVYCLHTQRTLKCYKGRHSPALSSNDESDGKERAESIEEARSLIDST